nr:54S ribosomal protein L10, mitochondrial-like [Ipomoea batatas]
MLRRRLLSSLISSTSLYNAAIIHTNRSFSSAIIRPPAKHFLSLQFPRHHISGHLNGLSGRGIGSGKGKTACRGHKGQKARGTMKFGFEGGQTPLRRRLPKRGFKNPFSLTFQPVGLGKIAKLINAGKIDSSELITMKILKDSGAVGKQIGDGVRLMGRGAENIEWPIHLEVSRVTVRAKAAVEAKGGSVRRVHYNKLGLRALLKPEWFEKKGRLLPRPARPPPKLRDKVDSIGRLPAPTKPIPFTPGEKDEASASPA